MEFRPREEGRLHAQTQCLAREERLGGYDPPREPILGVLIGAHRARWTRGSMCTRKRA